MTNRYRYTCPDCKTDTVGEGIQPTTCKDCGRGVPLLEPEKPKRAKKKAAKKK